jgi:hypothetical protein
MQTVTSFHSSHVSPEELTALMAEYVALDQARIYRRLFVTRFALLALALGVMGFGFHWLSRSASLFSMLLCAIPPTWAWVAELRCELRLTKRLRIRKS